MITRSEIDTMSGELGVHTSHVQRDYVFGWLLSQLYSASDLGEKLVLKGGNCFRKAYFPGARYSGDLDFSSAQSIGTTELSEQLNAICEDVQKRAGLRFDLQRTMVEEASSADDKTISKIRLYFRDFYGKENEVVLKVRLDISQFDRLYLPIQQLPLIHQYSDAEACATDIRCVKLEELLATKMRCLLQRRHIADLFDLVYATLIDREVVVDRAELLATFFKITIFRRSPGVAKGLFIDLPLEALSRYWDRYISCPDKSKLSFGTARDGLLSLVESLIPGQAIHDQSQVLFPSSLRNPIMQAGESLTLLKLCYEGVNRLVEPYSLAFKIRKDGVAREYFYAYDTTGGRSSGPCIKSFLPGKATSIENTDIPFEPRYEVELKKAGGSEMAGHFKGRPSSGLRRLRKTPRFLSPLRTEYTIQCPYCQRKFKRKRLTYTLRKHKDRYGNQCYGRRGHRVW